MDQLRFFRSMLGVLCLIVLLPAAVAQQGGQTGGNAGQGGSGGQSRPEPSRPPANRPPQQQQPQPQRRNPEAPQIIYLSGSVVLEDGGPLPSDVVIERICGGQVRREATTSPSGHFSFQIGGNRSTNWLPDASEGYTQGMDGMRVDAPGIPSRISLFGCELRARASGYRSSSVLLTENPGVVGIIDVGVIVLSPLSRVQGTAVSATNLKAPKAARKALGRAEKSIKKKDFERAEQELKSATELYPEYVSAWFELGQLYRRRHDNEQARRAFEKAVALDALYVSPYIQLAAMAAAEMKWQEAADLTDHALNLNPLDFPQGFLLNALAHWNLRNFDAAERSARKGQRLDGSHQLVQLHLILASILERKSDLGGSMDQLRSYLKFAPRGEYADRVRMRLQEMERFSASAGKPQP